MLVVREAGPSLRASNDTGGVIACFTAGAEERNWWPRLCRPTPPAVPAQDDTNGLEGNQYPPANHL